MTNKYQMLPDILEETPTLRCNRCGTPISPDTAVRTPTGYRCKDCVRAQQKTFDTAQPLDALFGFGISAIVAFAGAFISDLIGFFTLLLAPAVGTLIATLVRAVVKRRRSKLLFKMVLVGAILGSVLMILITSIPLLRLLFSGRFALQGILPLIWKGVFTFLCSTTAYYRLSGIKLN